MSDALTSPTRDEVKPEEITSQSIATRLQDAHGRKSDGNDYFRQSKWNEALVTYQAALNLLPKRRDSRKETTRPSDEEDDDEEESPGPSSSNLPKTQTKEDKDVPEHVTTEAVEDVLMTQDEQKEVTELRSALFSNIGACHVKLRKDIEGKLRKLQPRIEAAQKEETSEMLGKLKGLGNSLLGNFGLSVDNFKLQPNGQGGYSVNFVK
ncbi:hypothetical protein MD484_g6165, partial [Candolleomyces efflorescens]